MMNFFVSTAAIVATSAFVIAPGRAEPYMRELFIGRNFAHRGLHNIEDGIPENSLAAFRAARENGFGIELDLQLSKDGQVIVFHDHDLKRMCGVDATVDELTYAEMRELRLAGTNEHIPLFSEALETMGGLQPLLCEIKPSHQREELCKRALELMRSYKGELCMESFDPFAVAWFRKNAPEIMRGQLTSRITKAEREAANIGRTASFLLTHVLTNFMSRPHFIAHSLEKKTITVRAAEKMGALRFAWTSRDSGNEENNDSVIFEGYVPQPKF